MLKEMMEVELNGKKYLYDAEGNAFIDVEDNNTVITFSELRNNAEQREKLGYTYDIVQLKRQTGLLLIQSHAIFDVAPQRDQLDFLAGVFPVVQHVV